MSEKRKSFVNSILQRSEMNETPKQEVIVKQEVASRAVKQEQPAEPTKSKKHYTTHLYTDNINKIRRIAYWTPGLSETSIVNQALEEFFKSHPEYAEAVSKPTPKE